MRTPEEIREHVEAWEGEDEIKRCTKCGAEITGDFYYVDVKENGDCYCEDCIDRALEEWCDVHRRVY